MSKPWGVPVASQSGGNLVPGGSVPVAQIASVLVVPAKTPLLSTV
jgi:hypothetical protein